MAEQKSRKIKVAFISIGLGIIGSFLWEIVLSPIIDFLINTVSSGFIWLFTHLRIAILDSYYQQIAQGNLQNAIFNFLLFLFSIYFFRDLPNIFIKRVLKENNFKASFKKMLPLVIPMSIIVACIFGTFNESYFYTLHITTKNNIEIVCPYISEQEYKELKSRFYAIKQKTDYESLKNDISKIAYENNLKLQKQLSKFPS